MPFFLAANPIFPVSASSSIRREVNTDQIVHDLLTTNNILFLDACLYPFTARHVSSEEVYQLLDAAQRSILSNISVVKEIADVDENDLRVFFDGIQIFEIEYRTLTLFSSISSYDGARIYLNKTIVKNQAKASPRNQQLLEHQIMNCLSCWGKFDPYLVSSWCNRNLRSVTHPDAILGAGHFYDERVYQKIMHPPSPFQINNVYQLFRE